MGGVICSCDVWLWALICGCSRVCPRHDHTCLSIHVCVCCVAETPSCSSLVSFTVPAGWSSSREFDPEGRRSATDRGFHQPAQPAVSARAARHPSHHRGGGEPRHGRRPGGQGGAWVSSRPAAQFRFQQRAQHLGVLTGVSGGVTHTYTQTFTLQKT